MCNTPRDIVLFCLAVSECGHYKYVWIQEVMDIVKCVPGVSVIKDDVAT